MRVSKACTDAGFMRKISLGQNFLTIHDVGLNVPRMYVTSKWWEFHSERMDSRKYEHWPGIGSHRRSRIICVSIWKKNQRYFHEEWWISILDCDQQGYEQRRRRASGREWEIYSLRRDGYRYGEALCEGTINSTITFVLKDFFAVRSTEVERHSAVDYIDKDSLSFSVSKTMTRIPRHRGLHREDDGAMDWDTWSHMVFRDNENASKCTNPEWSDLLHRGRDKKRFQYCLNGERFHPLHSCHPRSLWRKESWSIFAGQSDNSVHVEWVLLSHWFLSLYAFYHPFRIDCRREIYKRRRLTVFFTAGDPMSDSQEGEYHDVSKPQKGSVQDQVESVPGCNVLDQSEKCSR